MFSLTLRSGICSLLPEVIIIFYHFYEKCPIYWQKTIFDTRKRRFFGKNTVSDAKSPKMRRNYYELTTIEFWAA